MALFFPLDVEYASDDEFIEAGPMAELLFIRVGCFIKRKRLDGRLRKSQLTLVSTGIPNPKRHAGALVAVRLWVDEGDEWFVPSYLKHNPSKAHLEAAKEIATESGARGAHNRWHVPPDGAPNPKCAICIGERMGYPKGSPNRTAIGSDSQLEPIVNPTSTHGQPTDNPTSFGTSSSSSKSQPDEAVDDDDFQAAIEELVHRRCDGRVMSNERAYRAEVRREAIALDGDSIRAALAKGSGPSGAVVLVDLQPSPRKPIPWCGPECDLCEGSAFVEADGGLAPCPNRKEVT